MDTQLWVCRRVAGLLLLSLVLGVVSCSSRGDSGLEEPTDQAVSALTDIVLTSRDCPYDVISGGCFSVPPKPCNTIACMSGIAASIDGIRSPHEYSGATEMAYTDQRYKAEAKVYARAFQTPGRGNAAPAGAMKIFFEDMPVQVNFEQGPVNPYYVVFIDHDRFTGTGKAANARDDFYIFDITGATPSTLVHILPNGSLRVEAANFHSGGCEQESAFIFRCKGELLTPLSAKDLARFPAPDEDVDPGVGFAVFPFSVGSTSVAGGLPEFNVATKAIDALIAHRELAVSLLFGRPRGFNVKYMTWNIRRSTTGPLAGPFKLVPDPEIGKWLADKADVIALQEGWDRVKMKAVLNAANLRRAELGKQPFYFTGPPEFESSIWKKAIQGVAGYFIGNDGTNGGIYTLSSLPIVQSKFHVYGSSACKGEDCFKAKGVLWTRILLNPPTVEKNNCQTFVGGSADKLPCDKPPSGAEYVDVFNTHLQATNTQVCAAPGKLAKLLEDIPLAAEGIPPPLSTAAAATVKFLLEIAASELNCDLSDAEVQRRQLDELNAFINQVTPERDRPVIIMGDFNIDGKSLGAPGSQYRDLIKRLHIGPLDLANLPFQPPPGSSPDDFDDLVNPWPVDQDWDVDHGDVARQFYFPYVDGPHNCMGTFIGESPLQMSPTCVNAGLADGNERYDYILVRPPYQMDQADFESAKWVMMTNLSEPWQSPYPGEPPIANTFQGPPHRLSDHKPVLVGLEHAKLVVPPKFHPNWKHDIEFRVWSADASNFTDCSTCGAIDLKVSNWGGHVTQGANSVTIDKNGDFSHECDEKPSVAWPANSCMDNWNWPTKHTGSEAAQFYGSHLWDDDDSSADDSLPLHNHDTQPVMTVFWSNPAWLALSGWEAQDLGVIPQTINDTAPVPLSTITPAAGGPTNQTLLFTAKELLPAEQF